MLVAFTLHTLLGHEPSAVALLGGLLLLALSRLGAREVAQDVEWPTLIFFAGLFVMVGALVATGVIDTPARAATGAVEGRLWPATVLLLGAPAALSAIVDNIPYVATMSPIVGELVDAASGNDHAQVLWWALALGADLGGNATAVRHRPRPRRPPGPAPDHPGSTTATPSATPACRPAPSAGDPCRPRR
nr:SLC13 family permease [uncultured Actinoplanes sp.]